MTITDKFRDKWSSEIDFQIGQEQAAIRVQEAIISSAQTRINDAHENIRGLNEVKVALGSISTEVEPGLKIGDPVQMAIGSYPPLTGTIANIIDPGNKEPMYRIVADGMGYWRRASEITKVEPEPKLKIGDRVEVLNARTINQPRVIGTITDSLDRLNWTVNAGGINYYRSENSLRKVEPESKTEEPRKRGGLTTGKRDN